LAERLDFGGLEVSIFRRHGIVVAFGKCDTFEEFTLGGILRHEHRAIFAAFHGELAGVEAQFALLFLLAMALRAVVRKDSARLCRKHEVLGRKIRRGERCEGEGKDGE
jgi:hypothetical protein